MCEPLLYLVGISIFSDLELQFEFNFLCARYPDRAEAPVKVLFEKNQVSIFHAY